jgi:hypothetical protein
MNMFTQNSILIMSDMIRELADKEGGARHLTDTVIMNITNDDWADYCDSCELSYWYNQQST